MTRIEVERVDPAEALRRIRARLVELGLYSIVRILDEEWPNAAVTE